MYYLFYNPLVWILQSLAVYFSLLVSLELIWRCYKLFWSKRRPIRAQEAVFITGATSGIGLAVSKHLFNAGYSIIVGYYDAREAGYAQLQQLSEDSKELKQKMLFIQVDVRSQDSISSAYDNCKILLEQNNLKLYALINNAGLGMMLPFSWFQRKLMRNIIETNLLGSMMMCREFMPLLIRSHGRILNVSSGISFIAGPTCSIYGSTKSALLYFTRSLNTELLKKPYGVRSIALCPNNYIKLTNIAASYGKQVEDAQQELKEEEKELYKKELAFITKQANLFDMKRKKRQLDEDSETKKENQDKIKHSSSIFVKIFELLKLMYYTFRGVNTSKTLEQSGVVECFEDALTIESPPECMLAGNIIFQTLAASILLSLPTSIISIFANSSLILNLSK